MGYVLVEHHVFEGSKSNEAFAKSEMTRLIIEQLKNKHHLPLTAESTQFINNLVMKEYLAEFRGHYTA